MKGSEVIEKMKTGWKLSWNSSMGREVSLSTSEAK